MHMHYHFFCPAPKIQGKSNLSKVGYWEQLSDKPRNSFSCPVLTYHFLVPFGALECSPCLLIYNCLCYKLLFFQKGILERTNHVPISSKVVMDRLNREGFFGSKRSHLAPKFPFPFSYVI